MLLDSGACRQLVAAATLSLQSSFRNLAAWYLMQQQLSICFLQQPRSSSGLISLCRLQDGG